MTADAAAATSDPWNLLACLAVMTAGMLGAATSGGIAQLSLWRVIVGLGLGIGCRLAATNAAVAPASLPVPRRSARSTSIR
ncbi:hypothetical protein [Sphingomonas sp. T9W2]|uniref:hypothetical protein n=1 Tax=Sphingomonas sp. T9W2 TaxID=3143183 RepID=UPI0031F503A3